MHPHGVNQNGPDQASGFFIDGMVCHKPWTGTSPRTTYVDLKDGTAVPHDFISRNVKQFYIPNGDVLTGKKTFFAKDFAADGTMTIATSSNSTQLQVTPLDPAKPVEFHVIPTEWRARWEAGEVISPDLIARCAGFCSQRFMDSAKINGNLTTKRPLPTDETQYNGLAVEHMVAICNAVGQDMVLPIGAHWDDATIADAITVAYKLLDARLKINVEYANEVWNGQFEVYKFALDRGNAMFTGTPAVPAIAAAPGIKAKAAVAAKADPNAQRKYYGYQSGRIANIIKRVVFHGGKPSTADLLACRVKVSLAWKRSSPDAWPYIVQGYEATGAPRELINDISVANYPQITTAERDQFIAFAKAGDTDSGVALIRKVWLVGALPVMALHAAQAKAIGPWVEFRQYETSIAQLVMHAPFIQDKALLPVMVDYCTKLTHSDAGVKLYADLHDAFIAAGGTVSHYYNLIGVNSEYGIYPIYSSAQDETGFPIAAELARRNAQGWAEMGQRGYFGPSRP